MKPRCIIIQGYFSHFRYAILRLGTQQQMARGAVCQGIHLSNTHTHTHIMRTHAECALIPHRRLICSGYRPGTEQKLEVLRQLRCLPPAYRIKGGRRGTGDTLPRQNDKEAFVFILPNQTEPCLSLRPVGTSFAWSPGAYALNIFSE